MNDSTDLPITFTSAAIEHVLEVIQRYDTAPVFFRLSLKQAGCSGYMYQPEVVEQLPPDDIAVVVAEDLTVYVAVDDLPMLSGTQVDYVTQCLGVKQLVFDNPHAESACGCGESVMLKGKISDES